MSFWGNDDSRARELAQRKEEERRKAQRDAKVKAEKAAAAKAAAKIRAKKMKELRAEQDAEDKKIRDELVEKMLNGGKDKKSTTTFPTLNRGFGGDRAQPTDVRQCFKNLKQPGTPPQIGYSREALNEKDKDDKGSNSRGGGASGPPLRRPF
jgi:hypothetical protein